jgi:hypothetical protein
MFYGKRAMLGQIRRQSVVGDHLMMKNGSEKPLKTALRDLNAPR